MTWVNPNNFIHHTSKESLHGSKTHIFYQRITLRDEHTGQEYALVWMKHSNIQADRGPLLWVFTESHNYGFS